MGQAHTFDLIQLVVEVDVDSCSSGEPKIYEVSGAPNQYRP